MDADRDAIDRVRRDLAALGGDAASAPSIPEHVGARVDTALRAASHAARGPLFPRRTVVTTIGVVAALAGIGVGTVMLLRPPQSTGGTPSPTAAHVTRPAAAFPVDEPALREMLHRTPDFGSLADADRRTACLASLGYRASTGVLGAAPVPHGVVLLLPGPTPDVVDVVVVAPTCGAPAAAILGRTQLVTPSAPNHP